MAKSGGAEREGVDVKLLAIHMWVKPRLDIVFDTGNDAVPNHAPEYRVTDTAIMVTANAFRGKDHDARGSFSGEALFRAKRTSQSPRHRM